MATTIDKDIFDNLVRNQINLASYSEQQARDLVALLNRAEKDIIGKITDVDNFTQARLRALLREIQLTVADTYKEASSTLNEEMSAFAPHAGEMTAEIIAAQLPVSWNPVAMSADQYAAILSKVPIRLGADHSLLFDEIFKNLAAGMESKVRGAIRLGMVEGETAHQIAARVGGKEGVLVGPKRDIYNLTHTVVQHTNNHAAQITMDANSDVLRGWVWVSTLDSRTCLRCAQKSGIESKMGEGVVPPLHIGCRCFQAPVIKSWKELGFDAKEFATGTRASSGGQVDANISFDAWLRTQSKSAQIDQLGPARQQLFANGMKVDKFTNNGKVLTLEQLKNR